MKWPSRLSLGVKSRDKSNSIAYLSQVLFYCTNVAASETHYFNGQFLILLCLCVNQRRNEAAEMELPPSAAV